MPPRNPELPEGTDHIVNGAMATGGGTGGGSGAGFIGGGGGSGTNDDTGGTVMDQAKGEASSLKQQAVNKVRDYAEDGKARASDALRDLSQVVNDAANSVDQRLGSEYGTYARRAADAVSGFADSLQNKPVDELYNDARNLIRKSPAAAIGIAAAVGFAVVRLVKSGMEGQRQGEGEVDVEFTPDMGTNAGAGASDSAATTSSGTGG